MKKLPILTFLLVLFVSSTGRAQFMGFSMKSNNQIFIEQALKGAFSILEQHYQLKDTVNNEIFGREGKDYFSIIPYLAVRTQAGILINQDAAHPWLNDEDFKDYQSQYKPIVFKSLITDFLPQQKSYESNPIIDDNNVRKLGESAFLLYTDSTKADGIACDTLSGSKAGWMVWIVKQATSNPKDSIRLISYKKEILVNKATDTLWVDTPNTEQEVLGGIYVDPVTTGIGQLTFKLTGVALWVENHWVLQFPFIKETIQKSSELTIIKSEEKYNQLPKKKKK